jgi:hypothetical protein
VACARSIRSNGPFLCKNLRDGGLVDTHTPKASIQKFDVPGDARQLDKALLAEVSPKHPRARE